MMMMMFDDTRWMDGAAFLDSPVVKYNTHKEKWGIIVLSYRYPTSWSERAIYNP